jgi:hypothetical protein
LGKVLMAALHREAAAAVPALLAQLAQAQLPLAATDCTH